MGAALRPSDLPPTMAVERTARAKTLPRSLATMAPKRYRARALAAGALDAACTSFGVSSASLAESMGLRSDRAGDEARSGALVVTAGDVVVLAPLPVAIDSICELLLERLARERVANDSPELRLARVHVDALRALLAHST